MATGAADILRQCVFDGSISIHETEIQRRPYHRDCKFALHRLEGIHPTACSQHRTISFPKKQAWKNCSFSMVASKFSSLTSSCSDLSEKNTEYLSKVLSSRQ